MSNIPAQIRPTLEKITIYPIKSLDGAIVNSAQISTGGALMFDRRWAIVDGDGKVVNAKRTAKIHQLRSQFDLDAKSIDICGPSDDIVNHSFCLCTELPALAKWLSEFFEFPANLIENILASYFFIRFSSSCNASTCFRIALISSVGGVDSSPSETISIRLGSVFFLGRSVVLV